MKLKIDYTEPKRIVVWANGVEKRHNDMDSTGFMAPLNGDVCGENRWDPVNAVLEFTMQGGFQQCMIELKTQQTIQMGIRMDMTLEEFYSNDGELSFIEKLAKQLNISRDRIKVVGVRRGSVILNVVIEPNQEIIGDGSQASELEGVSVQLQAQINNGTLDVGAPILDFDMLLSTTQQAPATTTVVAEQPKTAESLMWPITIMVSSACVLIAAVLLLVLFLKKLKSRSGGSKKGVITSGDIFKKVVPDNTFDITGYPSDSRAVAQSDRELKQSPAPVVHIDRDLLDRSPSFTTKVEEI